MRRLKCWLGFHKRSRGMTRYDRDGVLRSHCRCCRAPLVMTTRDTWTVDRLPTAPTGLPTS